MGGGKGEGSGYKGIGEELSSVPVMFSFLILVLITQVSLTV